MELNYDCADKYFRFIFKNWQVYKERRRRLSHAMSNVSRKKTFWTLMLPSCVIFSLLGTIPVPKIDKEIDNIISKFNSAIIYLLNQSIKCFRFYVNLHLEKSSSHYRLLWQPKFDFASKRVVTSCVSIIYNFKSFDTLLAIGCRCFNKLL